MRSLLVVAVLLSACEVPPIVVRPASDAGTPAIIAGDCLRIPALVDFGEVATGQRAEQQLSMGRVADRSVLSFVGVQPPFNVQARPVGSTTTLVFAFTPIDARLQVQRVDFVGGPGCEPQSIELRGLGGGSFEFTRSLDFGPITLAQTATRMITITNTRRRPVNFTMSTSVPFSVRSSVELGATSSAQVPVTAHLLDVGVVTGTITLRSDVQGDAFFEIPVTATGGIPRVQMSVTDVHVETLAMLGTNVGAPRRRLTLANVGDGPLRVEAFVVTPGPNSELSEVSLSVLGGGIVSPGASKSVDVRFFINARPGPRSWHVELRSDDPLQPVVPIEITANAAVVQPCATAALLSSTGPAGSPADRISLAPPYPASATLRLTNPSSRECLFDEVHLAGASTFSITPPVDQLIVPARGTAEVTVTAVGPGADTLRFLTVGTAVGYQQVSLQAL